MSIYTRIANLFRRRSLADEIDKEMLFHISERAEELELQGMSPADALLAARRQFGNMTSQRERTRDVDLLPWVESIGQDLRYGCRTLARSPGFTLVAITSIALGIGATTSVFSFGDALLLRPLPVPDAPGVVALGTVTPNESFGNLSYREFVEYRDASHSFAGLAALTLFPVGAAVTPGDTAEVRQAQAVNGGFFETMGVSPMMGRTFRSDEDAVPGRDRVTVLGYNFWKTKLAADPAAVGRKLRLNGIEFLVIGVMPESFTGVVQYRTPSLYVPLMMWPQLSGRSVEELLESRSARTLMVKGRLQPGVKPEQASAEVATIAQRLSSTYDKTNHNVSARVLTEFGMRMVQDQVQAGLAALLGVLAITVLLVACANVAGLLLSRAATRTREIAIRLAIGSDRLRLVRQLLTESILIGFAGGGLGLLFALAGTQFLRRTEVQSDLEMNSLISLDRRALICAMAVSLVSALLCGLAPALASTRADVVRGLKVLGSGGPSRLRFRNALVVSQIAASLVLLTVASVCYLAFRKPLMGDPGFRRDHLLVMTVDRSVSQANHSPRFFEQLVERAPEAAGVRRAALTSVLPMSFEPEAANVAPEGFELPKNSDGVPTFTATVDEGYFAVMSIPILRGRGFLASDRLESRPVAIVNDAFAERYWTRQDPIGKRVKVNGDWVEVVGVTPTGKYGWIAESPTEFLYLPLRQHPRERMTLVVETLGEPSAATAPMIDKIRELDADQPVYGVRTIEAYYQRNVVGTPSRLVEAIAALGLLGLALAMVGLYALVSYSVSTRTREIGLRLAVGADAGMMRRMVILQGVRLGALGVAVGLLISLAAQRLLLSALADAEADAIADFVTVPLLLAITAAASYLPAWRASCVDPMVALREE